MPGHFGHEQRCWLAVKPVHFIEEMRADVFGSFIGLQGKARAHDGLHHFRPAVADPGQGAIEIKHHVCGLGTRRERGEQLDVELGRCGWHGDSQGGIRQKNKSAP